jgi:type II secretory pathway component PulJ
MNRTSSSRISNHSLRGATLVDLLCASALGVVVLAGTMMTFAAVQRSFTASLYQINSLNDQSRVFSYLRRDVRGASSVQISAQGTQLTLAVPAPDTSTLNLNLGASLLSLLAPTQSAASTTTIRYYRQGTSVIREVNGTATELSSSATQFQASLQGTLVQIDTGFQPRFTIGTRSTVGAATQATALVHLLNPTTP